MILEYTLIFIVVAISGGLLARRFYRQLRALLDPSQPLSCSQGCCGCSATSSCHQQDGAGQRRSTGGYQ